MESSRYLPSRQFALTTVALLLSAGLVYAADSVTKPTKAELQVGANVSAYQNTDWQASLNAIQDTSGVPLPDSNAEPISLDTLIEAAKSGNLTDAVSRGLFANLINAKNEGLGDDIPTQEKLIQKAVSQVDAVAPLKTYTAADLTVTENTNASMRAYGNATMSIFIKNSDQEFAKTLLIMDAATNGTGANKIELLGPIQKKYQLIEAQLAATPVPKTLQPFHLQLINDYAKMAATYDGMQNIVADPLGAFAALQQYRTASQDVGQMFINIAQTLDKNDILFNTDEPGATWGLLLQAQNE